jgi:uncharacterized protein
MNERYQGYAMHPSAIDADSDARERFIVRTYNHLFVAIVAFAGLEVALFKSGAALAIMTALGAVGWIGVLVLFVLVSFGANHIAFGATSKAAQYAALAAYVVVEAVIFVPLLFIADLRAPGAIQSAGLVTMVGFAGLTAIAFVTRKDFSFLRGVVLWGGLCALVLVGAGLVFGFHLGTVFSVAMVALAGASILYDTSNVLHHFPVDRYVGAALKLFAAVALMFWYVLRIFIGSRR